MIGGLGSAESIAKPASKVGFAILFSGACVKSLVMGCSHRLVAELSLPKMTLGLAGRFIAPRTQEDVI